MTPWGELYEAFLFNLQVRYVLGLRTLGEGNFELRTLYNFRSRVSIYMQESGENLYDRLFSQVTDEQLEAMKLSTGTQRMDSTLVGAISGDTAGCNYWLRCYSGFGGCWRKVEEGGDSQDYGDCFSPYIRGTSGQYCYGLKGDLSPHFSAIGGIDEQTGGRAGNEIQGA